MYEESLFDHVSNIHNELSIHRGTTRFSLKAMEQRMKMYLICHFNAYISRVQTSKEERSSNSVLQRFKSYFQIEKYKMEDHGQSTSIKDKKI